VSPDEAIDRILELSAQAQTKRREAAENSPTFHKLTGAVLAYGEALDLLTRLRKESNWKQRSSGTSVAAARLFLSYFKFISATANRADLDVSIRS
jgi:hypothetical protein